MMPDQVEIGEFPNFILNFKEAKGFFEVHPHPPPEGPFFSSNFTLEVYSRW
jgi:hypothetical protein